MATRARGARAKSKHERGRAAALALALAAAGCAGVVFEDSPYTVRDLQVVWSEQEGLTFLSWKLARDAVPERVRFELEAGGEVRVLELDASPFPAAPWRCGDALCFQYQVEGRLELADGARPLTSILEDGPLAGPEPVVQSVERTFDVDAFPFGRNDRLELDLWDWFGERGLPLRRTFEWQLVEADDACGVPVRAWRPHDDVVEVDRRWTASAHCAALRPARADGRGPHVAVPLAPSAETRRLARHYLPDETRDPVVYGLTFDLEIPDAGRCAQVQNALTGMIDAAMAARDPGARRLGPYRPVDAQGAALDGCAQAAGRRLPVDQALADLREVRGEVVEPVRIVWLHLHNLALPPSDEVLGDVERLLVLAEETAGALPALAAVAPRTAVDLLPPELVIPWRPVSDETLAADLETFARQLLPFRTQLHQWDTAVAVEAPPGAATPEAFKLCEPLPRLAGVGADEQLESWPAVLDWPDLGEPFFLVDLGRQEKVPFSAYELHDVTFVLEVCDAFCDAPFRLQDGTVLPSWRDDPRCRRVEEGEST